MIERIVKKALEGTGASVDEALELNERYSTDELCDAADRVCRARCGARIDTCSIVNARSGRCSEDCKWCAQSRHHKTGIEEYDMIGTDELLAALRANSERGVNRFSLVTSGRKVGKRDIERFAEMYRLAGKESPIFLCASMGLLDKEDLAALYAAGVRRYHCNLETSARFFGKLCTTHTHAEKIATIKAAREVGMEVCSGGIIGMGETMRDRLEMTVEAVEAGAVSVPMNILNPIKGTALEGVELIGEDEIVRTAALMRLVAPDVVIRFAGGRKRLSAQSVDRMLRGGVNGALVGDMLTTVGNGIDEDYEAFKRAGLTQNEL